MFYIVSHFQTRPNRHAGQCNLDAVAGPLETTSSSRLACRRGRLDNFETILCLPPKRALSTDIIVGVQGQVPASSIVSSRRRQFLSWSSRRTSPSPATWPRQSDFAALPTPSRARAPMRRQKPPCLGDILPLRQVVIARAIVRHLAKDQPE